MCCQLAGISRFVIRREKTWCPKSGQKFKHSMSITESPEAFVPHRMSSMSSENLPCVPITLTFWREPDFPVVIPPLGNHAVIRPLCLLACPQILTVYLHVLRCVLHFTKPVKCLLKTTDDAKIKQVFFNAVVYSSLHPFGESQLIFVGQKPV